MNKKYLILGLIISTIAFYLAFRNVSLNELFQSLRSINYYYLLFAIFIVYLTLIIRAYRWKFLLLSIKETTTCKLIPLVFIGSMGNFLPGRAGEFIRSYLLGKKEGLSMSASLATIIVERMFDMSAILVLIIWLLLFKSNIFEGIDGFKGYSIVELMHKFGWFSLTLCLVIAVFLYSLVHWNEKIAKLITILASPLPEHFKENILHLVDSFVSGLQVLKDFKTLVIVSLLTFLLWFFITISYYPIFIAYYLNTLPFSSLVVLEVIICALISIFPTPGFFGTFQVACVVTLHNIFQVSEVKAASFGLVSWATQFGIVIVFGVYYVLREGLSLNSLVRIKEEKDV